MTNTYLQIYKNIYTKHQETCFIDSEKYNKCRKQTRNPENKQDKNQETTKTRQN